MPLWYWGVVAVVLGAAWTGLEVAARGGPERLFAARAAREWLVPVMIVLALLLVVLVPALRPL